MVKFIQSAGKQRKPCSKTTESFYQIMEDSSQLYQRSSFEQRFNCLICWSPRLCMVYGSCQHRLCVNCLYDSDGMRRSGLGRCPTCQREDAFPVFRPSIPEDNIAAQRHLGVVSCTSPGCKAEMWQWELEDHLSECCFSSSNIQQRHKKRKSEEQNSVNEYNLRRSSKRHTPGRYSTSKRITRSAKRKMNSA